MANHYGKGQVPNKRFDLVQEVAGAGWAHGLRVHDHYAAVGGPGPAQALARLDAYMAAHKPVMAGVSHTLNLLFYNKNKKEYYRINDGTIDHFVAIVGTGVDGRGNYYRFFDVGTVDANREKGISPLNRLYYIPASGFYEGNTQVGHKPKYTLTQLRFF